MSQNLLKGLCISLKELLMKWEKVNLEGKKTFESLSNNLSELRIVAGKKDNDFGLYSNVCQDIIQEKSSEIIKMLNTLGERLTILEKIANAFCQQADNIKNTLIKSYEESKWTEGTEDQSLLYHQIEQNGEVLKVMLTNEIGLKQSIIKEVTELILQEQVSMEKFNECKFLLQLWTFNPYIQDSLFDRTLKLVSTL